MRVVDEELVEALSKSVAERMLHASEMQPAYFHGAFCVLGVLCRHDGARGVVRKHVNPDALTLFGEALPSFAFDAQRLADLVGSA